MASGIFSCCRENLSFHHANSEFQFVRSSSLTRDWGAQSLNCLGHLGSPWNNLLWEKFILSPFWSLSLKSRCRQGYAPLKNSRKESSRFFPAFDRWWQSLIFRGLRLHPSNLCPCHFMAFFLVCLCASVFTFLSYSESEVAQLCWLFATPWTVAYQAPPSMEYSPGKNTGVDCHFLPQGIFPTQGSNPDLLHCRQTL